MENKDEQTVEEPQVLRYGITQIYGHAYILFIFPELAAYAIYLYRQHAQKQVIGSTSYTNKHAHGITPSGLVSLEPDDLFLITEPYESGEHPDFKIMLFYNGKELVPLVTTDWQLERVQV